MNSSVLEGTALIRATNRFASEVRWKSWFYVLSTLALMLAGFAATIWSPYFLLKAVAAVITALLMCRMFVIYHDFQHQAILKKSWLATILLNGFGMFALTPPSIWKWSHDHHHDHNSKFSNLVAGSFPIITAATYQKASKAQRLKYRILRNPWIIILGYVPVFLISFCLYPFIESPKKHFDCGIAALIHVGLIILVHYYLGWEGVWFTIFLPFLIVSAVGGYIFYAQHNSPDIQLEDDQNWDYVNAALNSSSYIEMSKPWAWITANVGYHHVHHINSRIPFYRLPEAMAALEELQHTKETSLRIPEIIRCLQLKLWDASQRKMITMKEYHQFY